MWEYWDLVTLSKLGPSYPRLYQGSVREWRQRTSEALLQHGKISLSYGREIAGPGYLLALRTTGEFQYFPDHIYVLSSDGCEYCVVKKQIVSGKHRSTPITFTVQESPPSLQNYCTPTV